MARIYQRHPNSVGCILSHCALCIVIDEVPQVDSAICVNHCIGLLDNGDKDLAVCATSVSQMLSLCSALQQLAHQNSRHLLVLAKVVLDACNDCEAECKKHADRHEPCKTCMESCRSCANQCRAALAT